MKKNYIIPSTRIVYIDSDTLLIQSDPVVDTIGEGDSKPDIPKNDESNTGEGLNARGTGNNFYGTVFNDLENEF